jgi:hypothetical protein
MRTAKQAFDPHPDVSRYTVRVLDSFVPSSVCFYDDLPSYFLLLVLFRKLVLLASLQSSFGCICSSFPSLRSFQDADNGHAQMRDGALQIGDS